MRERLVEGSPNDLGPVDISSEVANTEVHPEDRLSDDEPETELEALQHLPPEERRKALRRLRNRESARRVRARRLAEVSQMGTTLQGLQDDNAALKAHVSKLQSHIQSMTLKMYEVTAKYETVLAENAQLRSELIRYRRPSFPGDSSLRDPSSAAAAAANGPHSAPLRQLSPFISPMEMEAELAAGGSSGPGLSPGHMQLRSSSPADLQQQRQALEEVVLLLKEHKRQHQGGGQDRSGGSEIGSCGPTAAVGNNATSAHSPTSGDTPMAAAAGAPPLSSLAAGGLGTNNSSNNSLPYKIGDMSRFIGGDGKGVCALGSGVCGCHSEIITCSVHQDQYPQQPQQPAVAQQLLFNVRSSVLPKAVVQTQLPPFTQQVVTLPQQQQALPAPGPFVSLNLPVLDQPQLPPAPRSLQDQSHSQPLIQLHPPLHHQYLHHPLLGMGADGAAGQQQPGGGSHPAHGSAALYNNMASLSLPAPFFSAASALPPGGGCDVGSGGGLPSRHTSGPNALGSGVGGIVTAGYGAAAAAGSCGLGAHHRSASYALDRGTRTASAQHGVAPHSTTWQEGCLGAGGAVTMLRPEELTEDILMSFDECLSSAPQDL